ncbi:SprT-like domain-containing protein [Capnocytophaga canimorsus]|uniref:SprT-like domain-containing protein n=1 Tax=Capnocytophaga canimorsus TaxID=28188 RepID=UPI0037D754B0
MKTLFKFLGIMAFLLVAGCQKTDDDFLQEGISLQETKTFFEKQEAEKEKNGIDFEITPKWETFMQGGENREGNFSASVEVIVNQGDFKKGVLFILQKGKTIRAQILIKERILENVENQMLVFDLQGVLKKVFYVEKGKLKRRNVKHTPRSSTSRTTTNEHIYELEPVYVYGQGSDTPDRYHIMELIRYYDSFMDYPEQGSGESDDSNYREENDRDYSIKPRGGNRNTPPKPEHIIDNLTDPCAKRILNQMRFDTGRINIANLMTPEIKRKHNFSQMIIDLFEKSSQTHLTFTNGITKNGANGSTKGTTITLNNNYLQTATQLAIARTIIHEMVHAYLNATYRNYSGFENKPFWFLLDDYFKKNKSKYKGANRLHHEFMKQYVEAMAFSLQQWDIQYGTRRDLGFEYYKALSFGGLFQTDTNGTITTETDGFKELVPKPEDRQDIADKILNEQNNTRNAKGTKCK